jgi:alpha-tubulin suppressor-like RCC1 family protein
VRIGILRFVSVSVLAAVFGAQQSTQLSAQNPGQVEGPGWLVAYGGGGSLAGALGVTAAVVSPPVALRSASDPFDDIVDASTSSGHTLIVRRNGSVWSMGANDHGQLGLGFIGDPIESLTQTPGLVNVVKVVASGASSYAIDSAGTLWVWGHDEFGQLGIGQPGGATERLTPVTVSLPPVVDVDAGLDFAVAADVNGAIWAWGANAESQLGAPGPDRNIPGPVTAPGFFAVDVAAGGSTSLARAATREVMGWGSNSWLQIANSGATINAGTTIVSTDVIAMGAGDGHVVMASANGTVQIRGANWAGQLGNGTQMPTPGLQTISNLSGIVDVAAGAAHSVAIANDGLAYAWGFNHKGQLLFTTDDVFTATPQQVLDVPPPARFARAKSETTILLTDPAATPDLTPPVISSVTPSITTIAPPNHHMVPVTIAVAATDDTSVPVCVVSGVSSNEPAQGDWEITGPLAVRLRAERAGNGNGRVYTVAVRCTDAAGNTASGSARVFVPKGKQHP